MVAQSILLAPPAGPPPDLSSALDHLLEAGLLGLAVLDADGSVRVRNGVLSAWLPEVGGSCFESPILLGLEDDLRVQQTDAASEPITLPGICLAMSGASPRCDIAISWEATRGHHVVMTTPDQVDRPIDHWVMQQRREQRLLEEKIIAASHELERINRNLRDFTSVAAHDLRAPLRQIVAFTGILRGALGPAASPLARDCIGTIETCAGRLTRMTTGLLDYARLGSESHVFEPADLNRVVAEACRNLDLDLRGCAAELEIGALPTVIGVPILLTNLFQNLIANSIRYREPGRILRLAVRATETSPGITVQDNGIGVPAEFAQVIFQTFARLPNGRVPNGVGLGLSICRRIAELHGWRIELEHNGAPGACFRLDLASV